MDSRPAPEELLQKVLTHMHARVVTGSLNCTAMSLRMKDTSWFKDPRYPDLRKVADLLGADGRRDFFAAVAAIAEFALYGALDFIEMYNRFDAERNKETHPSLSLAYLEATAEGVHSWTLSRFGSEEMGRIDKRIARSDEMRAAVDRIIDQLATQK
jgi:hypothetical protein